MKHRMEFDEVKLIQLVRGYPELYDSENDNYMNQARKNNIWNEISAELGIPDEVCRKKWKLLRDAYHRAMKRREELEGVRIMKKWRLGNRMEFLRPHIRERNPRTMNTETIVETIVENVVVSDDNTNISDAETVSSPLSGSLNSPCLSSRTTPSPDPEIPGPSSKRFKKTRQRKKSKLEPKSEDPIILENSYLDCQRSTYSDESIGAIHSFFKAMADTIVFFAPEVQLRIKNEVYNIVSQAEFENIKQKSTSSLNTDF